MVTNEQSTASTSFKLRPLKLVIDHFADAPTLVIE